MANKRYHGFVAGKKISVTATGQPTQAQFQEAYDAWAAKRVSADGVGGDPPPSLTANAAGVDPPPSPPAQEGVPEGRDKDWWHKYASSDMLPPVDMGLVGPGPPDLIEGGLVPSPSPEFLEEFHKDARAQAVRARIGNARRELAQKKQSTDEWARGAAARMENLKPDEDVQARFVDEIALGSEAGHNPLMSAIKYTAVDGAIEAGKWAGRVLTRFPTMVAGGLAELPTQAANNVDAWAAAAMIDVDGANIEFLKKKLADPDIDEDQKVDLGWKVATFLDHRRENRDTLGEYNAGVLNAIVAFEKDLDDRATGEGFWGTVASTAWNTVTDGADALGAIGFLILGDVMGLSETPYEEQATDFWDWTDRLLVTGYSKGGEVVGGAAAAAIALAGTLPKAVIARGDHDTGLGFTVEGKRGFFPQAAESRLITLGLYFLGPLRSARARYVADGVPVPALLEAGVAWTDKAAALGREAFRRTADGVGIDKYGRARVDAMMAGVQRAVGDSLLEVELNQLSKEMGNQIIRGRREAAATWMDLGQEAANIGGKDGLLPAIGSLDEGGLVAELHRLQGVPMEKGQVMGSYRWQDLVVLSDLYWRDQGKHPGGSSIKVSDFDHGGRAMTPTVPGGKAQVVDMVRGYLDAMRKKEVEAAVEGKALWGEGAAGTLDDGTPVGLHKGWDDVLDTEMPVPAPKKAAPKDPPPVDVDGNRVWNAASEFGEQADFGRPLPGKQNRWGITSLEWDAFKVFALDSVPELRKTGIESTTPAHLISQAAFRWYSRAEGNRPLAAVKGGLHQFTPVEVVDFARYALGWVGMGASLNKALFNAYRDIRNARPGRKRKFTSDFRDLELDIPGVKKKPAGGVADNPEGLPVMEVGAMADERPFAPAGPTTRTVPEAVAQFNKVIDENYPEIVGRDRFAGYVDEPLQFQELADTVNRIAGGEKLQPAPPSPAPGPVNRALPQGPPPPSLPPGGKFFVPDGAPEWVPGGVQQTLALVDSPVLPPEFLAKVNRVAEGLNLPAEPIAAHFIDLLDANSGKVFESGALRKAFVKRFEKLTKKEGTYDHLPKNEQRRARASHVARIDMIMNSYRLGRPVANPRIKNVRGPGGTFDVKVELRNMLLEKPKVMKRFMKEATMNATAAMADAAGMAHVTSTFRRGMAAAPDTIKTTAVEIERNLLSGSSPMPPVLRVSPALVAQHMLSRRGGPTGFNRAQPTVLQSGETSGRVLTPNDVLAVRQNLEGYRTLGKDKREWLGLVDDADDGATYVTQAMYDNIGVEMLQESAIKTATWIDKIARTAKRGYVALSLATTFGNLQSDLSMGVAQQGDLSIITRTPKVALEHHNYRHGKMKRSSNKDAYDMHEKFVQVELLDATILESEGIGMQNHKGVMSLFEGIAGRVFGKKVKGGVEAVTEGMERYINRPSVKLFRGATNAVKLWRAERAWLQMKEWTENVERNGATFEMEVFPNVKKNFRKNIGPDGKPVFSVKGKDLTHDQWLTELARASKVTSDRLFFDYNDASLLAKGGRAIPGLRAIGGSMFYMWLYKSVYVPGIKRGLIKDVWNPNPAYRSSNPAIIAEMAEASSRANVRTASMASGARAARDVLDQSEILEKLGFDRREASSGWLQLTGKPDNIMVYNASNINVFSGQELLTRIMTTTGVDFFEAIGAFDDESGELGRLYPPTTITVGDKKFTQPDAGLDHIEDPSEKRWIKQMRKLVIKNSSAGIVTGKDYLRAAGMAGGPILDALVSISNDDRAQRPTDMKRLFRKMGNGLIGANAGRAVNIIIAAVDPASESTSFTYTIRDPKGYLSQPPGERHRQTMRWAMRTAMTRTWSQVDLVEQGLKRYADGWKKGWEKSILDPFTRAINQAGSLGDEEEAARLVKNKILYQVMISTFMAEMKTGWGEVLERYKHMNNEAFEPPRKRRRKPSRDNKRTPEDLKHRPTTEGIGAPPLRNPRDEISKQHPPQHFVTDEGVRKKAGRQKNRASALQRRLQELNEEKTEE